MSKRKVDEVFRAARDVIAQIQGFDNPIATQEVLSQIDGYLAGFVENRCSPPAEFVVSLSAEIPRDPPEHLLIDVEIRWEGGTLTLGGGGYFKHSRGADSFTSFQLEVRDGEVTWRTGFRADLEELAQTCQWIFSSTAKRQLNVDATIYMQT